MYCWLILIVSPFGLMSAEDLRLLDLPPEEAQQYIEKQDQSLRYAPKIESNVPALRVLGDTPTNVLEDIYLANQYHGQDGLGGYLYGYSVPDIAKSEKKEAHGDLKGAYQYINGDGQEIKVQYWDDGMGFHQTDNLPDVLPKQVEDSPEVEAAKQEFFKRWHEEAERNSHPISADGTPSGTAQSGQQHYQPGYFGGGQTGQSFSGQYQQGQSGHPLTSNQQGGIQHQSPQGQYSLGGGGQYQSGPPQTGSSHQGFGSQTGQYQSNQNQPRDGQYTSGQTQSSGYASSLGKGGELNQPQIGTGAITSGQGGYLVGQGSQFQPQYQPHQNQVSTGYQSSQGKYSSSGSGAEGVSPSGPLSTSYQPGQLYSSASGSGQTKPGNVGYQSVQSSAQGGNPSDQAGASYQPGQSQSSWSGSGQTHPSHIGYQSSQGSAQGGTPSGQANYQPGQLQSSSSGTGQYQPSHVGYQSSQGSSQGGSLSGQANFKPGQLQYSSSGTGQYQPGHTGYQSGQGSHTPVGSSSGQAGYQSGSGCCGSNNGGDYSGQYSNKQETYAQNQDSGSEWEYKPTEEEKGPPRGFFYNFDYPVGIIVQKQGESNSLHKRESLEHLYKENKANFEIQVRNGASSDGSSQVGYQVHL